MTFFANVDLILLEIGIEILTKKMKNRNFSQKLNDSQKTKTQNRNNKTKVLSLTISSTFSWTISNKI